MTHLDSDEALATRLRQFFELCQLNLYLARAGVKLDYLEASPEEVNRILKQRLDLHRLEKWKGYGLLNHK